MVETEPFIVETAQSQVDVEPRVDRCRDRQFPLEEFEGARLVAT